MTKEDIIRMAREAGMPLGIRLVNSSTEPCVSVELERFAKLVAAALEREHALHELARLGQEIEQEPTPWREMVVVSLVREGIDKHRARELADHFAAQRQWVGLTDDDRFEIAAAQHGWEDLLIAAESILKDKNT